MSRLLLASALALLLFPSAQAQSVFINELHYDDAGADANESVEVAGPAGTDLTDYSVVLYNGSNGTSYGTIDLSGTIDDEGSTGFGAVAFAGPSGGIQNGGPDGLALVDDLGTVLEFLSYEGSFTATNGPAIGLTSTDIGVSESSSGSELESLQRTGPGTVGSDFSWTGPVAASAGDVNAGQVFGGTPAESAAVAFNPTSGSIAEDGSGSVTVTVELAISNEDGGDGLDNAVSGSIEVASGDASDVTFTGTFDFSAGTADGATVDISVSPVDDGVYEGDRILGFGFTGLVNATGSGTFELTITEDEPVPPSDLIITGVIDGTLSGGLPKALEVYVVNNIADLSIYGLGSANNGGGSDGEEFTFPADAATAGEFIYVSLESPQFTAFFGFGPDYTDSAIGGNGDDAYELFLNGGVVDVFGDINASGSGQPWEYTDGWAYRGSGTGPDGPTFTLGHWAFSGKDALDGETTNASATTPFPIGTYVNSGAEIFDGPGWRLLGVPGSSVDVADLAGINLVQGVTGEYPTEDANLYLSYSGLGVYGPAPTTSASVEAGKGFMWYWFDSAFGPFAGGTSSSEELSTFTLPTTTGTELTTNVDVERSENTDDDFYMLANPFRQAFDVGGISVDDGTLSGSFLAYDPALGLGTTGATSGGYVELTAGDQIAVWQGVFAEVTGTSGNPTFTYDAASRVPAGTPVFFGRADRPTTFALMLDGEVDIDGALYPVVDAVTKARFRDGATDGFDRFDLSELAPPNGIQASLAFATERDGEAHRLGVHSMPETLKGSVTLPVEFASTAPGTFTIAGELVSIPEGWTASLRDLVTGDIVDLTGGDSHTFTTDTPTEWTPRFELVVSASSSVATEGEAEGFELGLVTPNPAVASATLDLRVDAPQFVTATVVDALGRVVATPFADELAPSTDAQIWVDTAVLAPGTYVVRVEGETFAQSRRLTVVR
ncbi:MAG: hypothetical protein Rubg2KO_20770 [Rubricoccaceae bacterium]